MRDSSIGRLCVTRRQGESIVIGDGVEIEVVLISENEVRLAVVAPKTVAVFRKELLRKSREVKG